MVSDINAARNVARHQGWLSELPEAFRSAVLSKTSIREFDAGENIHFAGDDAVGMYGVVSGTVRVMMATDQQGPYFIHLFRPGTWFGEGPSIAGQPRPVTLTASRPVVLLNLSRRAMQEITQLDRTYWRYFVVPLMRHLNVALVTIADQLARDHEKRIAAVLLRLAGCRNTTPEPFQPTVIDASQEEIAVMTNLSRNAAGVCLRRLEASGIVKLTYGQLTLLAPNRLRESLVE